MIISGMSWRFVDCWIASIINELEVLVNGHDGKSHRPLGASTVQGMVDEIKRQSIQCRALHCLTPLARYLVQP